MANNGNGTDASKRVTLSFTLLNEVVNSVRYAEDERPNEGRAIGGVYLSKKTLWAMGVPMGSNDWPKTIKMQIALGQEAVSAQELTQLNEAAEIRKAGQAAIAQIRAQMAAAQKPK
jgi:hypothetical protein